MRNKHILGVIVIFCPLLFARCSFDYGAGANGESALPDISMNTLEYARVKRGELQVRLKAEEADRYENRNLMELRGYSFQQYDTAGVVDAEGHGGLVRVELDQLNVYMREGITISVETEDMVLETDSLDYSDREKTLKAAEDKNVTIEQSDGTSFKGAAFSANVRKRDFVFESGASGVYVHEDDEEEE
jgi:LPS export ABC transporter protein LptC